VTIARVLGDIVRADDPGAFEGRGKDLCVARHRKFGERFERHARQRIEHVAFAGGIQDIVEEGAELRTGELDARVGDDLDQLVKIGFERQRRSGTVENLEVAALFRQLLFGFALPRTIAQHLGVTGNLAGRITDGRELSRRPDQLAVLALPPALLAAATPASLRVPHLRGDRLRPHIVGKQACQRLPAHFSFAPAENAARALIPAGDPAFAIGGYDRGIDRTVDDLPPFGCTDRQPACFSLAVCHVIPFSRSRHNAGGKRTFRAFRIPPAALVVGKSGLAP
jgi:hypothetical protein